MSMVTGIGLAVVIVALFWILYIYAIRRARFLVRMQLGSFPEQRFEDAKTAHTASADQLVKIDALSKNIKIEIEGKNFLVYEDGSVRILHEEMQLCLDLKDIALLYQESKKALIEKELDREDITFPVN